MQDFKTVESNSEKETYDHGFEMGKKAYPGQVCTLIGELGVGQTVFTQGFAAGLGVKDYICSPTFTIVQVYDDGRLPFYHFDVYRIGDESEMEEIGYEEYVYGDGVSLIEWADLISDILPDRYTRIEITKDLDKGFDFRNIKITEVG